MTRDRKYHREHPEGIILFASFKQKNGDRKDHTEEERRGNNNLFDNSETELERHTDRKVCPRGASLKLRQRIDVNTEIKLLPTPGIEHRSSTSIGKNTHKPGAHTIKL